MEKYEECWYYFFKGLVQCSSEFEGPELIAASISCLL
jgi:hypothetical protein